MRPPSTARQFYERITTAPDPVAFLKGLVNSTPWTFETDWRDFKGNPKDDSDRLAIWFKALGGFANNQGGVIVWGIDARPQPCPDGRRVDAACGFRRIPNPGTFESLLRQT